MTATAHAVNGFPGEEPAGWRAVAEPAAPNEVRLRVTLEELAESARSLCRIGARLITITLTDDRGPEPSLLVAFALRGALVVLRAPLRDDRDPFAAGSVADFCPAARWPERELRERLGAGRAGRRLLTDPDADLLDRRVEGADAFTIPHGPVRSGVFEAIQFQIETGGENVVALQTRPFFKHRGLERRLVGMAIAQGAYVAERIAGIASVAYGCAYAQAIERALGIEVPRDAERWRVVHAELERIACHLDVVAKEAETTALFVANARFTILKERVMRIRARLSGSRFGRGVVVPGGVRSGPERDPRALSDELEAFERDFARDRALFTGTASMTDRLIGAGRLPFELLDAHGAVGPLARGSGVFTDARHERPYGEYRRTGVQVMTRRAGDAMARIDVRFDEIVESLRILRVAIDRLGAGAGQSAVPAASGSGAAFGWAEAPQGELLVWVEVRDGTIATVHFASPSLRNWALFDYAFPRDVLTDFAFIEHSFGLTPAGADR